MSAQEKRRKAVMEKDLYDLLGISHSSSLNEIKKAYRKKALKVHPDKNPDSKAAELFHELSLALEILADESARSAYDHVLKAREATKLRNRELDAKRRKLKEDLEARERLASSPKRHKGREEASEERKLEAEIERLRKEGSTILREEQEALRTRLHGDASSSGSHKGSGESGSRKVQLKAKWKVRSGDEKEKAVTPPLSNPYDEASLRRIFSKYGDVTDLIVREKRNKKKGTSKGTAIIEMSSFRAAEMALKFEVGVSSCPLVVTRFEKESAGDKNKSPGKSSAASNVRASVPKVPVPGDTVVTERDYESLVLRQMRQAEERKRLIQAMMAEEDGAD